MGVAPIGKPYTDVNGSWPPYGSRLSSDSAPSLTARALFAKHKQELFWIASVRRRHLYRVVDVAERDSEPDVGARTRACTIT